MSASVLFDAPGPKTRRRSLIISLIVLALLIAGVVWIAFTLAQPRESSGLKLPGYFAPSRWDIFADPQVWGFIGQGLLNTLRAAAVAAVMALVVGVLFAMLRTSVYAAVRIPTTVVLEFFRGMPVLLMMLFILLVASTGAFWAVVIALGIYNGAIIGEALRSGLASLPRGQREAGLSLGLTRFQTKASVEFPQAFRQMLPIIVAQLVVLLKDTSLGYIVAFTELLYRGQVLSAYNHFVIPTFVVVTLIYLVFNGTLSTVASRLRVRPGKRTIASSRGAGPVAGVPITDDRA